MNEELEIFMNLLDTHAEVYLNEIKQENAYETAKSLIEAYRASNREKQRIEYAKAIRTLYIVFGKGE
jgi:hypothetical protein